MNVKVIVNPTAGRQVIQRNVDRILADLLTDQTISRADIVVTAGPGDATTAARQIQPWETGLIMAVGGDGTVNEVVNGMIASGHNIPLAILPAGTANDFAYTMKIPRDVESYCAMIRQFKTVAVDAGRVGDTCFLNVVAGGMLADIPFKVPSESKTVLGQLAYVLSGAIDLPAQLIRPIPVSLRSRDMTIDGDILMFIITNTRSVGGFRSLAPRARVDDGLLDVLVIHRQSLLDLVPLLLQLVNGDHLDNRKVSYFQTDRLELICRDSCPVPLDVDGEPGPVLPAVVEAIPQALRLLVP